jgi:hypothetical protein
MAPEKIKARGRRITDELFNQGDLSVMDELIDPSYTEYLAAEHKTVSPAEMRRPRRRPRTRSAEGRRFDPGPVQRHPPAERLVDVARDNHLIGPRRGNPSAGRRGTDRRAQPFEETSQLWPSHASLDHARPDQARPDQARPDHARPAQARWPLTVVQ